MPKYILSEYAQSLPDGDVRCEVLYTAVVEDVKGQQPEHEKALRVEPLKEKDLAARAKRNGNTQWGDKELCDALSEQLGITVMVRGKVR